VVYFRAPQDQATWLSIATTGKPETRTADELRDEFYKAQFANCQEKALDVTRDNEFSGVLFKSLGATCNLAGNLFYSYIGLGLNKAVPWRFQLNSPYNQYSKNTCRCEAGNIEKYFGAMLDSLTIYANP
jgi:hypothetical protein